MIKVFYGDNRVEASNEIKRLLGDNYEVIDGTDLALTDLPSIFLGASLFTDQRNILIRDFTANKPAYAELKNYLNTPHNIILLESRLEKNLATYKELKDKLEFKEFTLPEDQNFTAVFNIYRVAKRDGKKAVSMLEDLKTKEDPNMFLGLLASQAIKDFSQNQGTKEKKALKDLSRVDLEIKSAKVEPWLLIESFLVRLSSLR